MRKIPIEEAFIIDALFSEKQLNKINCLVEEMKFNSLVNI